MSGGDDPDSLSWTCHACGRERPDEKIGVHAIEVDLGPMTSRLTRRHCVDVPLCLEKVIRQAEAQAERMRSGASRLAAAVREQQAPADVIRLPTGAPVPLVCPCGSWWFALAASQGIGGAVTVETDGRITGWHGELRCLECGDLAMFPQPLPVH